jgi:hypothetical protein
LSYAHTLNATAATRATGADDTSSGPSGYFKPCRSNATSLAGIYDYFECFLLANLTNMIFLTMLQPEFCRGSSYRNTHIYRLTRLLPNEAARAIHYGNELWFLQNYIVCVVKGNYALGLVWAEYQVLV